jgi:hypothetical protein
VNRYSKALRILSPKGQIEDKSLLAVKIVKDPAYTYPVKASEVLKYKGFQVNSHIPQGNPLIEKKNLDAVEPKEHKNSGKRIKSPQQFFNPADVKPEYPKDPPQEIANRFGKLDPQSAEAMPKTGNPHVDAKVEKAKNNPDKDGPAYRKGIAAKIKKGKKKTFEEFKDITESYWFPIAGDGPTNSASQTFAFGSADSGMHYTVDGLGGQTYSDTTEVYGEPAATPNYSQLAMQGYTPPLDKGVTKRKTIYDKQDENKQKIKDALKNLGTSWEEMRANNWALVKPDGTSIMLEPITPGNKQLNWIDNSKITVGKKHRDAGPGQNPYKVKNPDGSITMEFSEIVSVTEFRVDDELNKQLDASERFTKEINADEFMKGRVTDTIKPQKSFLDTLADAEVPGILDDIAIAFGVGTAKRVFDYHVEWNKTRDPKPQDLTNLLSPEDKNLLRDLVNTHSSNATDELIELGINRDLQHTIGLSEGLRNAIGVLDTDRGDGAKIEGNNIVIRKAYDFEGILHRGATFMTGIAAGVYAMIKGVFGETGTMNIELRIPLFRKRKKK